MWAGSVLFNSGFTEGRIDSCCGFAAGGEAAVAPEDEGGHPTLPLTGFLPEAAMMLCTTVEATAADVSTGRLVEVGTGRSEADGSPVGDSIP